MAADDLLSRGRADARRDRRHALRPALPLHGLRADRRRDRGGRPGDVNLAQSLLAACERHPELEAFPGIDYGELLPRVRADRGRPRRRAGRPRRGRARQPARDRAPLLGLPVGGRGLRPALVAALRGGARLLRRRLRRRARDPRRRRAARRPASIPARSTATSARSRSCSTPRARPAGRRACRARTPPTAPAGCVAGAAARLPLGRPHARRDAALPHDGHPLAARDAPRRRLLRAAGALGSRRGAAADRARSGSRRCTSRRRCSTTSSHRPGSRRTTSRRVRALGYAGAAMTSTLVARCVEAFAPEVFVNHYGSTEIYTFSIGRDQARSPAAPAGRRVNTRLRLEPERRDLRRTSLATRRSPATGTGPTPTRRRFATAGTTRATPAISTRTATCGSTAGSTT